MSRIRDYWKVTTTGQGNCLWNAVSLTVFGTETEMLFLRLATFYSFVIHNDYFLRVCRTERESLDFYKREALTEGVWGRDIHVLALSLVLQRPIYVFETLSKRQGTLELTTGRNMINIPGKRPIYIYFRNNHYEALIPSNDAVSIYKPSLILYHNDH